MGLSQDRILYGVHSIAPWRRSDRKPYGILKVIGSANLALAAELDQLFAGSSKFAWAAESKTISTDLTAKVKAYPNFLFELFLGATVTENAPDSAGTVEGLADYKGSSIVDGSNGIASVVVTSGDKADLKYGRYLIVALSANTFDLYVTSDIDFTRGTDTNFQDDSLKLNAAPLDISSASVVVAELGLTFTKAGTPAFVTGDTAEFVVRPPSTKSTKISVGQAGLTIPNFGADIYAAKRATGEMFEITAFNCVGGGLPIPLEENTFSQPELKMSLLYDSTKNAVFEIGYLYPENP